MPEEETILGDFLKMHIVLSLRRDFYPPEAFILFLFITQQPIQIKRFFKKEAHHEKSPVDFSFIGFGIGRVEYGRC
jgi:hypothetical protein